MKGYSIIRDWVDRQWRAPGLQFKVLLLPAMLPPLIFLMIGKSFAFDVVVWGWSAIWTGFVFWRYWIYLKEVANKADKEYDLAGKYRLAKEYHETESATAAGKRKHPR